jgi:hypothetical protein
MTIPRPKLKFSISNPHRNGSLFNVHIEINLLLYYFVTHNHFIYNLFPKTDRLTLKGDQATDIRRCRTWKPAGLLCDGT